MTLFLQTNQVRAAVVYAACTHRWKLAENRVTIGFVILLMLPSQGGSDRQASMGTGKPGRPALPDNNKIVGVAQQHGEQAAYAPDIA
ncbi:hypothetical protein [Methylobacillus flagellatus]|uniref:hypothetical protein n=1 Tax=Methylobacillus flagellatus TaxID=405 RepID=UPI0010F62E2A|nr:hypothetical protein [Methylobacillus flagellatus]